MATTALKHGIKSIGVVGTGQMGTGIALVAAMKAKVGVLVYDKRKEQVESGLAFAKQLVSKDVSKGRLTEEQGKETLERIRPVSSFDEMQDVGMVVEAAAESFPLKSTIFRELAKTINPEAILASNTSSISITKIARAAEGENGELAGVGERVVGLHFFNPVPVMKLVELISALQTSQQTLDRARDFAVDCGKTVTTSQDVPGFVSNALLMPFLNEAILHLERNIATRDDIDTTLKLGMGHPMGPLELADFIGLDTCLAIQSTLYEGTRDSKYRPSVLLERMVDAGWVGRKCGKGFYTWENGKKVN
ncbi:3-hydroxybutyryl- dehydrogenase [Moniliophthora roreri MCA 2997]|uniref:3-hydroxybutyryl-dehydrogenase n=2 Tax=Moniliophthora roreri TaxID=221103 RepID=V2WVD7_MONRO|nr:3-hydroxybutyryl- dehydrogenase [Moniliophthora roreri MCA 2997]